MKEKKKWGENKSKRKGITLVEVLVYLSILSILVFISMESMKLRQESEIYKIEKIKISQFIRKVQQYGQNNKKEYILNFKISDNKIQFIEEKNKTYNLLEEIEISKKISYMTNNQEKDEDFFRKTTNDGNFDKGFSIYLLNGGKNKIYYRISTNTINSSKFPIINIYKAINPININDNYLDEKKWEEEL